MSQDDFRIGNWQLSELDKGNMISVLEGEHGRAISNEEKLNSCIE